MKHTYKIQGMTCNNCVAKVKSALLQNPDVLSAEVSLNLPEAEIEMSRHISINELQATVKKAGEKYSISENQVSMSHAAETEENKTWFQTYKPLLLIFAFITGVSLIASFNNGKFNEIQWMNYFMAGFFIVFSFFKFLDLNGFADSYSSYDVLAKKVRAYGFVYPFLELILGIAYLVNFNPVITNTATIVVMGFSSIGVLQSVLKKQKIQCACLGTVFNLPMSQVTLIEDLLMVVMAGITVLLQT